MSVQLLPWLLHRRMSTDPVFFIVDHDEVVNRAEQHGQSGDSDIYRNAMGHVNENQVKFFFFDRRKNQSLYF